ncbi:hypothetical protein ABEB36_003047 [Hypothenemus hampei]|uniref:G-protein coupled receptors family 2 profile 2 domain-containing protein n=1 Tax=Hypothenemus hampei TaxID=57062 RepID=A0ABD1F7V0_HYPHA
MMKQCWMLYTLLSFHLSCCDHQTLNKDGKDQLSANSMIFDFDYDCCRHCPHTTHHYSSTASLVPYDPVDPSVTTARTVAPPSPCLPENTKIDNLTITWPYTNYQESAASDPLCLDERFKVQKRLCSDGWDNPPSCPQIQTSIDLCPPNLKAVANRYCYTILKKSTFPVKCPYPVTVGWDTYAHLDIFPKEPVWMPLERNNSTPYGYDLFRFLEPTSKYKTPYQICTNSCQTFFYNDTFTNKNCQVYHNNTHVEAVSCDAEYSALCVYDALPYQTSGLCQQIISTDCKQENYKTDSNCFCKISDGNLQNTEQILAEFLSPYQNLFFTADSCRIGLTRDTSNDLFFWSLSNVPLNYSYWSPKADFKNENIYTLFSTDGWLLTDDDSSDCVIYEMPHNMNNPSGNIELHVENDKCVLEITNFKNFFWSDNSRPMVRCFTDADANTLIYPISDFVETYRNETVLTLEFSSIDLDQAGPGQYWCEAFLQPNFAIVTSNIQLIRNRNAEYVTLFRLNNYEERFSNFPLTIENLGTLQTLFRNELPINISFYPRIYKINGIDESKKEINLTFHVTSAEALNTPEEFTILKSICQYQTLFEFLDFRNIDYCPESITLHEGQKVIWPETKIQNDASPLHGHCVTDNITLVKRSCIGNFIDGAYWSDIEESCNFYARSSLTDDLININFNTDIKVEEALKTLHETSKKSEKFNTLDFVLATKFIENISDKKPDLDLLTGIVSNLMQISRAVLLSAQLNFRSTDTLLEAVDLALEDGSFQNLSKPNFAFISVNLKTSHILGIQLTGCKNHTNCILQTITNTQYLVNKTYIKTEGVEAAISLSTDLYQQVIQYNESQNYVPKLVITVFYGSELFIEMENSKSSNFVFGVLLPGFDAIFQGPVVIHYFADQSNEAMNCSYWQFNKSNSGTWLMEGVLNSSQSDACEFYHVTNFGFPVAKPKTELPTCIPDDPIIGKCYYNQDDNVNGDCVLVPHVETFCVVDKTIFIPISCFKNFTNGTKLSEKLSNCSKTITSGELIVKDVKTGTYDDVLNRLVAGTAEYNHIDEVGFLWFISVLKVICNTTLDMAKFATVINNLMHVPTEVLQSSQKQFKALDMLLASVEEAVKNGECGEWKTDKFVIKCLNINKSGYKGIILKNCSNDNSSIYDCNIELLGGSTVNIPEVFNFQQINSIVVLSDTLYNQIMNNAESNQSYTPRMIVCLYYGTELFIDLKSNSVTTLIYGVLLPDFEDPFDGPLQIYYSSKSSENVEYNCSYWKFSVTDYGSWELESTNLNDNLTICEFFHLTNLALVALKPDENLISCNDAENIVKRNSLSLQCESNCSRFALTNSNLINGLTDEVFNTTQTVLDTHKILLEIDNFLQDIHNTVEIERKDILLMGISKKDSQYFQGITITKDRQVNCIFNQQNFTESKIDNEIDVTIKISEELQKAIRVKPTRIMLALFYDTKLFFPGHTLRLPVIDILMPDLQDNFNGTVSIQYENTFNGICSYWNYTGLWQLESNPDVDAYSTTCHYHHLTHFALVIDSRNMTSDLEIILTSNLTHLEKLKQVDKITTFHHYNLVPMDILLVSNIIVVSLSQGPIVHMITKIISNLFRVPSNVLRESQRLHSATDILLYAVDQTAKLLNKIEIHYSNFSLIVNTMENEKNFTGIILHSCKQYKCETEMLYNVINVSDYTGNTSISAMVVFNEELIAQLRTSSKNPKIIITIYHSNVLFNEIGFSRNTTKIFGIVFPEIKEKMNGSLSVMYNVEKKSTDNRCSYWHYQADPTGTLNNVTRGSWVNESNNELQHSSAICTYNHATHFGMLLAVTDEFVDEPILNLITNIGCILSAFGIFLIWLTAFIFKRWRQNTGNIILVHFSVALSLKIGTLYISAYVKAESSGIYCTVIGLILHYAVLSESAWMFTVAILQFRRFVEVLGGPPKYVLLKALICGWVFPLIPVTCVILTDHDNYQKGMANLCYPSSLENTLLKHCNPLNPHRIITKLLSNV